MTPVRQAADQELSGLLARLNQRIESHARLVAEKLGITASQVIALRELDRPMRLTELAGRMCCEASNAGYVVDRMADQSLITREPHPSDRRAKLITLTAAGQHCRGNVLRALSIDTPTGPLSASEKATLRGLIAKLTD